MYFTAENLLHHLLSRGIVSAESVVSGDYRVLESRRRNRNYRVLRQTGSSLFIKQVAMVVPETVQGIYREAEWYRLASELPALQWVHPYLPRLIDYHAGNHSIVTEYLSGSENLSEYHTRVQNYPVSMGILQAGALRACHLPTAASINTFHGNPAFLRTKPWIFSILEKPEEVMPGMAPATRQLIAGLQSQADITHAVKQLGLAWQELCLIHGDIKWDNFLRMESDGVESIKLIDWELCDLGDPAWDLACVFAAYAQPWLFSLVSMPAPRTGYLSDYGAGLMSSHAAAGAFWREYCTSAELPPVQAEELLARAVCFTGVRLLVTAFEILNGAAEFSPTVGPVLQVAREIFQNPHRARAFFGLAQSAPLVVGNSKSGKVAGTPAPVGRIVSKDRPSAEAPVLIPESLRAALSRILREVTILSADSFQIGDSEPVRLAPTSFPIGSAAEAQASPAGGVWPANSLPLRGAQSAPSRADSQQLKEALWPQIYWHAYARGETIIGEEEHHFHAGAHAAALADDPEMVARLHAANHTANRWDPAWEVYQIDPSGAVHVRKGDRFRRTLPGEYSFAGAPGRMAAAGARVDLLVQRDSVNLQPGFYFAFGDTIASEFDNAHLSRLYFNVRPENVDSLLRCLSSELNRFKIPYSFKCLNNPISYQAGRCDPAVLYVAKRFIASTLRILARHRRELANILSPAVPLFTKRVLPGIGGADEPGTGESFGQSRSRLVADGIIDAWQSGLTDDEDRLSAVSERFRRQGISIRTPYLNPGNQDCYTLPLAEEVIA